CWTVCAGDRRPWRWRGLAGGARHSPDLASMVAGDALHVNPRRRGAVHPLRAVRRHPVVASRLWARHPGGDWLCSVELSYHARQADGAPVRLFGESGLKTRGGRAPRNNKSGVTFAWNFVSHRQPGTGRATMRIKGVGGAIGLKFGLATGLAI